MALKKEMVGCLPEQPETKIKTPYNKRHCFDIKVSDEGEQSDVKRLIDADSVHRNELFKCEDAETPNFERWDNHIGFTCNTHELKLKRAATAAAKRCKGGSMDSLITAISDAVHNPVLITNNYVRVLNSKFRWDNLEIFGERGLFEVGV